MKKPISTMLMVAVSVVAVNTPATAQDDHEAGLDDPVTGRGSIARVLSQRDPFAWQDAVERHTGGAGERAFGEAMLQLVFDPADTSPAALGEWLSENADDIDTRTYVFASARYGERLMEIGRYRQARDVFRRVSEAVPETAANFENVIGILEQFGDAGPTRSVAASGATLATTRDAATLLNIPVQINGQTLDMIVDTGAEYTVLSASAAAALGVEAGEGGQTVGTSIMSDLEARFTVLPELRIGEMRFEDIALIVLPDSALTYAAEDSENLDTDYMINGVLGLPVMVAAGRVAWRNNGRDIAFGTDAPSVSGGARIYWHRQGVGLSIDFGNGPTPVFFDSGSRASQGSDRTLLELGIEPDSLEARTITTGGGGGFAEEDVRVLPELVFGLPGASFTLEEANIYPSDGDVSLADGGYAGADIVKSVSLFAVDFATMRYRAEP